MLMTRIDILEEFYKNFIKFIFYAYLFFMLTFGRAFAILGIVFPFGKIYITELFLILALPFIISSYQYFFALPRFFKILFFTYFIFVMGHFFVALARGNFLSLRDIVFFGYSLFFFLSLAFLREEKEIVLLLCVITVAAVTTIITGIFFSLCFFSQVQFSDFFVFFANKLRAFNIGLYFLIMLSFFFAFYSYFHDKKRWFSVILGAFLMHGVIILNTRSIWLSFFFLLIYFIAIKKMTFIRAAISFLPAVLIIVSCLCINDYFILKDSYQKELTSKMGSFVGLISGIWKKEEKRKSLESKEISPLMEQASEKQIPKLKQEEDKSNTANAVHKGISYLDNVRLSATTIEDRIVKDSFFWRFNVLKQAIAFGLESPFWGKGFGLYPRYALWQESRKVNDISFSDSIKENSSIVPAHNHLVTIFYKMGFVGLFLFLLLNLYVFIYGLVYLRKCCLDIASRLLVASLGIFISWHVVALFFDVIDSPSTTTFLWISMGWIFGAISIDKKKCNKRTD